jgi:3-dehydroquinate dehydratase
LCGMYKVNAQWAGTVHPHVFTSQTSQRISNACFKPQTTQKMSIACFKSQTTQRISIACFKSQTTQRISIACFKSQTTQRISIACFKSQTTQRISNACFKSQTTQRISKAFGTDSCGVVVNNPASYSGGPRFESDSAESVRKPTILNTKMTAFRDIAPRSRENLKSHLS